MAGRSKSGSRMRRASGRRTELSGSGLVGEQGLANPPTSATKVPTSSAQSARPGVSGPVLPCPSPIPRRCNTISVRYREWSGEAAMQSCCSTEPVGTPQETCAGPKTSHRFCCHRVRQNSIPSNRSGNICAPTSSRTASSKPTTKSSTPHAMLGPASSRGPTSYDQSEPVHGPVSVIHDALWYQSSPWLSSQIDQTRRAPRGALFRSGKCPACDGQRAEANVPAREQQHPQGGAAQSLSMDLEGSGWGTWIRSQFLGRHKLLIYIGKFQCRLGVYDNLVSHSCSTCA